MENKEKIGNFLKRRIFFTKSNERFIYRLSSLYRERSGYSDEETISWDEFFKSNKIYNHKEVGITNRTELMDQLRPLLYYLASKDVNCERYKYMLEVRLDIGIYWEYDKEIENDKYSRLWTCQINRIGSEFDFHSFFTYDNVSKIELEKPFEIHIDVEYYILIYGLKEPIIPVSKPLNSDKCVVCLLEKPELLFINCLHRCVCLKCEKTKPFHKCPFCKTDISTKVNI